MIGRLTQWYEVPNYDVTHRAVKEFREQVNREGVLAFLAANPKFPRTEGNATAIQDFLDQRNVPWTRANLELAWRELAARGTIEEVPVVTEIPPEKLGELHRAEVKPVAAVQVAPPTADEKKALAELADKPGDTDWQRKARDEQLRRLATASRIASKKVVQTIFKTN
jgi:hypothetical protein